ncbi:hypothetical protein LEP1GSC089_3965 [Leptospira interrogans serovar Autumnalis str. LP101]|nr:hypothetical protein LEP1GSC089_3965 [Leptospira interrogans serovar Autumnalis str. LP101]
MFISEITNMLRRSLIFFYHTSYSSRLTTIVRIFQNLMKNNS